MTGSTVKTPTLNGGYGALTMGALAVLLSATARPEPEAMEALAGWGWSEAGSRVAVHAAPVLLLVVLLLIVRPVLRGRSPGLRWSILGGAGVVAGFVMGLCLELFAGAPGLLARFTGPLSEASLIDRFVWILAAFALVMSFVVGSVALFGRGAVTALQVEDMDAECADVRRAERAVYARSAFAMGTLGIACAGLAVARQSETVAVGAAAIALAAALASVWANHALWRGFDELQRRIVVNGYAVSAIVMTLGAFAWALAEAIGWAPSIDASGVFLALIGVQLCATSYVATSVMGQMSGLGKLA